MRTLILCLTLACAVQLGAQDEHRYTKAELLASVDDTTATELRWLLRTDVVWDFSGGWMAMSPPRQRTAFARLICHGDVELLKRMARCEHAAIANYGLWGIKLLQPEVLVDLLPWLVDNPESAEWIHGDIGMGVSTLDFAADAVRRLSARGDKELLHAITGRWLDRIAKGHVTGWDWDLGKALVERLTPRGMRKLEYDEPERKELLELAKWLADGGYEPGLQPEDDETLRDRPLLRRTLLYFDAGGLDPKEREHVRLVCKELAENPDDIVSASTIWALLKFAHMLRADINRGRPLHETLVYFETFKGTPVKGREALLERFHEPDREVVRNLLLNPLIDFEPTSKAPEDPEMYGVWRTLALEGDLGETWGWLDADLAAHPERAFWPAGGALGGPMPDGSIPQHWLVFAKQSDMRYHVELLKTLGWFDEIQKLVDASNPDALKIKKFLESCAQGADINLKWRARNVLYVWARDTQGEEAALKIAQASMKEYASDLLNHPRVAIYPEEMMNAVRSHEWDTADETDEATRDPWYHLASEITECNTGFEERHDLETLTLEELRQIEHTPKAAWEKYTELKRQAESK